MNFLFTHHKSPLPVLITDHDPKRYSVNWCRIQKHKVTSGFYDIPYSSQSGMNDCLRSTPQNNYLENTLNKADLINHVASSADLDKASATAAVEAVLSGITNTLTAGDTVSLIGFGAFSVTDRAARTARNPRTGESIDVPASKAPKFKAGKALKDAVK